MGFAPAASAASTQSVPVKARVTIGFTTDSLTDIEATGLVTGPPFRRGAMELRSRFQGGTATGRFTLTDPTVNGLNVVRLRGRLRFPG